MTITAIREKLHNYIDVANDKMVEAIYTMVEGDIAGNIDPWENESFVNEMKSRVDDFESGKVECPTWEEVKASTRKLVKS